MTKHYLRCGGLIGLLGFWLLSGCGPKAPAENGASGAPAPKAEVAGEKFDLEKSAAREATGLQEVELSGGTWTAKTLSFGEVKSAVRVGHHLMLEIPIKAEGAVTCHIYDSGLSVGATLTNFLASIRKNPKIEVRSIKPWKLSVLREAAAVFVEIVYTVPTEKGPAVGQAKFAVQDHWTNPIMCFHDELGYQRTFENVAEKLMGTLSLKEAPEPPAFVEVFEFKLGDMPVGFDHTVVTREPDGTRKVVSVDAKFLPRSETDLMLEDGASVVNYDKNDRLAGGQWSESNGQESSLEIELKKKGKQTYTYQGKVQGKDVKGEFRTKGAEGLATTLSTGKRLLETSKRQPAFSFTQQEYHPGVDPSAPVDVKYWREKQDAPNAVHTALGEGKMLGTIDAAGRFEHIEIAAGAQKLIGKRAFLRGTP